MPMNVMNNNNYQSGAHVGSINNNNNNQNVNQSPTPSPAQATPQMHQQPAFAQTQSMNVISKNMPFMRVNATSHYHQQHVIPMAQNGNMNNVNLSTHLIPRPIAQTPQLLNIPLCTYYRSAVGCALGQRCIYRH